MVGNIPNYTKYDILRCFLRLSGNVGRLELSKELGLGEGTIRTILDILKSKNLLDSTKKGHFLSKEGIQELNLILNNIESPKIIESRVIYPEYKKIAVLLKKSHELKEVYRLRDIAVRNRAEGALILKFENRLYASESEFKGDFSELNNYFEFKNGDVLIIAFSGELRNGETGALAIVVELNDVLKKFINKF
ncbi:MAG TPA: DUF4443 domain-containing protein [Candidatus Nanoarchaeia archaeon]|nr:DUF4443 domain-containing protein [Candidatus Nanoarchaeia archaeon]